MSPAPQAVPSTSRKHRKRRSRKTRDNIPTSNNGRFESVDKGGQVETTDWGKPQEDRCEWDITGPVDWNENVPTKPTDPLAIKVWERQGRADRVSYFIPFWRAGVMAAEAGEEVAKLEDFYEDLERMSANDPSGWGYIPEDPWGGFGYVNTWEQKDEKAKGGNEWAAPPIVPSSGAPSWGWAQPEPVPEGEPAAAAAAANPEASAEWSKPSSHAVSAKLSGKASSNWHVQKRQGKSKVSRGKPRHGHHAEREEFWIFVEHLNVDEDLASPERKEYLYNFYLLSTEQKVKRIQEMVESLRSL